MPLHTTVPARRAAHYYYFYHFQSEYQDRPRLYRLEVLSFIAGIDRRHRHDIRRRPLDMKWLHHVAGRHTPGDSSYYCGCRCFARPLGEARREQADEAITTTRPDAAMTAFAMSNTD